MHSRVWNPDLYFEPGKPGELGELGEPHELGEPAVPQFTDFLICPLLSVHSYLLQHKLQHRSTCYLFL